MTFNLGLSLFSPTNTFLTAAFLDTSGPGGAGGSSPGSVTSTGTPGARGASANTTVLQNCSSPCVGGTCDGNGVCVPN
jgi:hypothetical protein